MAIRNNKFFTSEDLTLLNANGGLSYDPESIADHALSERIKIELWGKTINWHHLVLEQLPDFEGDYTARWNRMHRKFGQSFGTYTWTRIYKKGDKGKGVFFTVGIDGYSQSLCYKLDFQAEGSTPLNEHQNDICRKLIKTSKAQWVAIGVNDLPKYDWKKLVDETVAFIRKYEDLYDDTMNEVWNANQKRLARIAYNLDGWQKPSGKYGKSKSKNSYEGKYGYGNEEWLFDKERLIEGDHYAFLEPIYKYYDLYSGKGQKFDIVLYTVDADTGRRYWIGEIKDLEVISEQGATRVLEYYAKKGWLATMKEEIRAAGGRANNFIAKSPLQFFNVRFNPSDARLYDVPIEVPTDNPLFKINRYVLLNDDKKYGRVDYEVDTFDFANAKCTLPPENTSSPSRKQYERPPRVVEMKFLHREISDKLHRHFAAIYGEDKVKTNVRAGYGCCEVDMIIDRNSAQPEELVYYEIKTYDSLRLSIREALGQILEYAMWPDNNRAVKFVIVTQPCPHEEESAKKYVTNLRDNLNLNIYYQSFDPKTKTLSEEM